MSGWVAAALSADLAPGEAFATRAGAVELALWRDEAGEVHAFADRCPHRGMRLSLGFVRRDTLACLSHGWSFAGDGACRHIPAHPALKPPSKIGAARFPARESGGFVWVADAPPDDAPPDPATPQPVRSVFLRVTLAAALRAAGRATRRPARPRRGTGRLPCAGRRGRGLPCRAAAWRGRLRTAPRLG
jgi:phenylpropionate dioxygenase-like ring-hydroxylating dioxygenase large terminal subunit